MTTPIDQTIRRVGRSLRSYGLPRGKVRRMLEDLRSELLAAADEGAGQETIVGKDTAGFAARLAEAQGYRPVPFRILGLMIATALPMSAIGFIVYVAIMGGGPVLGLPYMTVGMHATGQTGGYLNGVSEGWFILATYALSSVIGIVLPVAVAAGYLALRGDPYAGRTARNMLVALPIGGAVGFLVAMFVGNMRDYSTDRLTVAVECATVATGVMTGLWCARQLARQLPLARSGAIVSR